MPNDRGQGKDQAPGQNKPADTATAVTSAGTRWDTDKIEWHHGLTLYVRDGDLAQKIYDALHTTRKFRLIVDGDVLTGIPADAPGTHEGSHVVTSISKDLDWDDGGCLIVKDKPLGKLIREAQEKGLFDIIMDSTSLASGTDGGPIGGNQVNGMCEC
jgi:hypothetical protein